MLVLDRYTGNVIMEIAVLTRADLTGADLRDAVLRDADLRDADLTHADLTHADLRDAVLTHADLRDAVLTGADLTRAVLDYSAWPLCCNSLHAIVDDRIAAQLLFHAFTVARIKPTKTQIEFIKKFHRFDECGGAVTLNRQPPAER
jgi:hypothetical protein